MVDRGRCRCKVPYRTSSPVDLLEGRPRTISLGIAKPPGARRWWRRRPCPSPGRSSRPAGRRSCRCARAAEEADRAPDGTAAVGVLADHVRVSPMRAARPRRGRFRDSRGPRPAAPRCGSSASCSAGSEASMRSSARSLPGRSGPASASKVAPSPVRDRGVVLAGDDVGIGDDQARRRDPARSLDPEAAGGAEHADDRAARPAHVGIGGDRRVRAAPPGSPDRRSRGRVDAVERVEIGPEGAAAR